ncbi:MAG TPA: hypothetical protein VFE47_07505 [Tepidisphaeraceae bacterium]|nr:hypothetical protein [Tepidisphaeraceae bacterium]
MHHINSLSMEASFGSIDELARTHNGGANYVATDGSVTYIQSPVGGFINTTNWTCVTPGHQTIYIGLDHQWGWWNTQ